MEFAQYKCIIIIVIIVHVHVHVHCTVHVQYKKYIMQGTVHFVYVLLANCEFCLAFCYAIQEKFCGYQVY